MNRNILIIPFLFIMFLTSAHAYSENLEIYFFYGPTCSACYTLESYLDNFEQQYDYIEVKKFDVYENGTLLLQLAEVYGLNTSLIQTPTTFVNDKAFVGFSFIIVNAIENEIKTCAHVNCNNPLDFVTGNVTISEITLPMLLGAAAADAVNPCAFAVLILLLTAILGLSSKIKALKAGLAFTVAVYISYLAMGFGLFGALQITGLSNIVFKFIGVVALIVGAFNIKDFLRPGAGGFIMEVPMSWRPRMKGIIAGATSVPGAFLIGFIVSIFLLPCTSGPYIVIITMLSNQATFWGAVPLLLLYNAIFILPMIVITLLVYFGFSTPEKAEAWRKTKIRYMHLIAGLIMIAMGIIILFVGVM